MNFSKISYRSRFGQLLRFPLRYIPADSVLPILQGKLSGYKWIAGSSNHGYWLGSYEYEKQQLISNTIKAGTVAFDIGAHVGFYTLLFSKLVGSEGKVFSFEPSPANLAYLRKHLTINRISNVTTVEAAVSDSMSVTSFAQGPNSSTGRIADTGDFEVEQVSIDELVNKGKLPPPNYIKMDIEGAEFMALRGAENTLREFHPTIFLATHEADVHQSCCSFLKKLGYELKSLNGLDISATDEIMAL